MDISYCKKLMESAEKVGGTVQHLHFTLTTEAGYVR